MIETSVIIPTFNRLNFLKEAIDSVLTQSYATLELLIVDDGSTDGTAEFVASLNDRVRTFNQPNHGPSAARNFGIRQARGEFIAFLDSDDLWLPDKLKTQIDFMHRNPRAVVCYTDEIWIRKGVRVNPRKKHAKHSGWIFEKCLPLCIVSPSSVLMRRSFFDQVGFFDEGLGACEDYDLWLRASLYFPFYLLPEKLIVKRGGHADQLSAQWGLDVYRLRALLNILNSPLLPASKQERVRQEIISRCGILEIGFRNRGKIEQADQYANLARKVAVTAI